MIKTTILRSEYSFEQFEKVLQNIAYEVALDAITNLEKQKDIRIVGHGRPKRLTHVETDEYTIKFYAEHVSFSKGHEWGKKIHFDVEKKLYIQSNHSTKISYWVQTGDGSEIIEEIQAARKDLTLDAVTKLVEKKQKDAEKTEKYGYITKAKAIERVAADLKIELKNKQEENILAFIEDMMKDVEAVSRFDLDDYQASK